MIYRLNTIDWNLEFNSERQGRLRSYSLSFTCSINQKDFRNRNQRDRGDDGSDDDV
ncbi:MAG: hypothetical protein AAF519_20635 [Bacteroidota bacterium]